MIPSLGSIVEDGYFIGISISLQHYVGQCCILKVCTLGQLIEFSDVSSMMFAIVEAEGVGRDVGVEGILCIWKWV